MPSALHLSRLVLLSTVLAALAGPAAAQGLRPSGAFFQAGGGAETVRSAASLGASWDWSWRTTALAGEFSAATELVGTALQADRIGGGRRTYFQLGLVPVLRYRFAGGRSPWFAEAGIGISVMDRRLMTPTKDQSSSWNFSDNLAIGRNFGGRNEHELSLRWQHTSNGGLSKPNPGFDLFFVRYMARF